MFTSTGEEHSEMVFLTAEPPLAEALAEPNADARLDPLPVEDDDDVVEWAVDEPTADDVQPWQAGSVLQYLSTKKPKRRPTDRWQHPRIIGPLAIIAAAMAIPLSVAAPFAGSIMLPVVVIAWLFMVAAYVLGTMGRRSAGPARRESIIARRMGLAAPLVHSMCRLLASDYTWGHPATSFAVFAVFALQYLSLLLVITLVVDGIFGTD